MKTRLPDCECDVHGWRVNGLKELCQNNQSWSIGFPGLDQGIRETNSQRRDRGGSGPQGAAGNRLLRRSTNLRGNRTSHPRPPTLRIPLYGGMKTEVDCC